MGHVGQAGFLNKAAYIRVVGHAADGREAIELAAKLEPDVFLMDIDMPAVNGSEVTRVIHRNHRHIRILGLSMDADEGTFFHSSIAAATPRRFECAVGWFAHYTIGIVLAIVLLALAPGDWLARPTVLPALLYGIGTVSFPLFVLQPSLGLGIASSKTPKPSQARLKSFVTHVVFGVGLYLCAVALSHLPSAA